MQDKGPQDHIFEEISVVNNVKWEFYEKPQPSGVAMNFTSKMQIFDEDKIETLLES